MAVHSDRGAMIGLDEPDGGPSSLQLYSPWRRLWWTENR